MHCDMTESICGCKDWPMDAVYDGGGWLIGWVRERWVGGGVRGGGRQK